jgi:APA family basic amino acid/polyamine antiporter
MKAYPVLPIIFIAAYSFVAVSIAMDYKNNHYAAAVGFSVLAVFVILYFLADLIKKPNA